MHKRGLNNIVRIGTTRPWRVNNNRLEGFSTTPYKSIGIYGVGKIMQLTGLVFVGQVNLAPRTTVVLFVILNIIFLRISKGFIHSFIFVAQ